MSGKTELFQTNLSCYILQTNENRKPHHEGVDALRAHPVNLLDAVDFVQNIFIFPEMSVTPKSRKMPNYTRIVFEAIKQPGKEKTSGKYPTIKETWPKEAKFRKCPGVTMALRATIKYIYQRSHSTGKDMQLLNFRTQGNPAP